MRVSLLILLILYGGAAVAGGKSCPVGSAPPTVFVNVSVIPMTDDVTVMKDAAVMVCGKRIASVGPESEAGISPDAAVIDGQGGWLMPGLHDMHVHLEHLEDPEILKLFLAYGVTTVRSMDGRPFILEWRDAVEAGDLAGPRIVTAGPIIDGQPPLRDDNLSVTDAPAARRAVRDQAAAGYDFVKVYDRLKRASWSAVVTEAKSLGLRVAGHVPDKVPIDNVIRAHWSIEHIISFGSALETPGGEGAPWWARELYLATPLDSKRVDALLTSMSAADVWIVPTLIERDRSAGKSDDIRRWEEEEGITELPEWLKAVWREQAERMAGRLDDDDWSLISRGRRNRLLLLASMYDKGLKIAAGTDTPNSFVAPGASLHRELEIYVEAGLTPGEALSTATSAPARMLGEGWSAGTIETGGEADLVLLAANPLKDIRALSMIAGVYANGQWYGENALNAFGRSLSDVDDPGMSGHSN